MITAARQIPSKIALKAFLISISISDATSAPVHAPVPGSGMPTNKTSPQNSYFSIWSRFFIALFSIFSTSGRNNFVFFIAVNIFLIKNKINGIGRIFPTALIRIPFHIVTSSNDDARIPPLSSRIGNSEIINTIASLEICAPKVLVNQVTRLSI